MSERYVGQISREIRSAAAKRFEKYGKADFAIDDKGLVLGEACKASLLLILEI